MRRVLIAGIALLLSQGVTNAVELGKNPDWCRAGYRCLTSQEYGAITLQAADLADRLAWEKIAARRVTWGCTAGVGVGVVIDQNFTAHVVPEPAAVTCGITLRLSPAHRR